MQENISEDSETELFETILTTLTTKDTEVFSAVASLCYGKHNAVDLIEFCGGAGRISQVAFKRKLESGGNLDLNTQCDLGDPATQKAIDHYLDVCHVRGAVLEPHCRSVGRPSYFNAKGNPFTWSNHFEEDLPHLRYCGKVAL